MLVRGGETRGNSSALHVTCTCPRFADGHNCKRLYAVLVCLDRTGDRNLTAADTVYLLDPWWNPAVEAQAIDRTHRIGQTKPVNTYRLVAKNTIEEKILALQDKKRALADAVINADASVLRTLTREDLEMLLA